MNKREFYSRVEPRDDWAFSHLSRSETSEISHSYHSYPSKFIPQLARALIDEYTNKRDFIWDPYCGSGTLNLEAFRSNRHSIGTDINPISIIISRAKTTPIEPESLKKYIIRLLKQIESNKIQNRNYYISNAVLNGNVDLLKKWFSNRSLRELAHILWCINKLKNGKRYKEFSLCAFSAILKRSSYWLTPSIKSQFDPNKDPESPLLNFKRKIQNMEKRNKLFYEENLKKSTKVNIFRHNAKHSLFPKIRRFDCIITSPPYVVSYDYSDIFRLSTYFLFYQQNYIQFRKTFIGTPLHKNGRRHHNYSTPDELITNLISDTRTRRGVREYYKDMSIFFMNAKKHLKKNGTLILVVGDTELRGINIPNAYLLTEIAIELGWSIDKIFNRDIPNKSLPTLRDVSTGKFTNKNNHDHKEIYNREYILVFRGG